jgi:hypothetical protein
MLLWVSGMRIHLTTRARLGYQPFHDDDACRWFWGRLRQAFRKAFAAALMPDHAHVVAEVDDVAAAQRTLARVVAGFGRAFGGGGRFERVPVPRVVPDRKHLLRQIRYVHLNPCRASLAADPCEWTWSTHREVLGAVVDPWVDAVWLAGQLGADSGDFARWLHGYVSGDPSVAIEGTPLPIAAPVSRVARIPLAEIGYATAAATRAPLADLRRRTRTRRLFICVAREQGWTRAPELAAVCGVTKRAIFKVWSSDPPPGIQAVLLCLGDRRLTRAFDVRRPETHHAELVG